MPIEVCSGLVVAGHGPPWFVARFTATPVGQSFHTNRPARRDSTRTRRRASTVSPGSAWIVAVSDPGTAAASASSSSSPRYSTMTEAGPKHSSRSSGWP